MTFYGEQKTGKTDPVEWRTDVSCISSRFFPEFTSLVFCVQITQDLSAGTQLD